MITPKDALDEMMATTAKALAVKNNLVTVHGEVVCWNCKGAVALMPHLHCRDCYEEWKLLNGVV